MPPWTLSPRCSPRRRHPRGHSARRRREPGRHARPARRRMPRPLLRAQPTHRALNRTSHRRRARRNRSCSRLQIQASRLRMNRGSPTHSSPGMTPSRSRSLSRRHCHCHRHPQPRRRPGPPRRAQGHSPRRQSPRPPVRWSRGFRPTTSSRRGAYRLASQRPARRLLPMRFHVKPRTRLHLPFHVKRVLNTEELPWPINLRMRHGAASPSTRRCCRCRPVLAS